ncbi:hypothetical protein [Metabacillus halosaccharovorans]|uniref:AAA+ ATPase domain-containing protein n=1 Tax=Metabacillus halosaccharovorans TaxID=930124 RepID=A0ABT3DDU3_9BACI|nr:hypothetical protein [Metabacillus halosaccharovorans]MCV9885122.1 hypothetical protein [Metabacillus halosaccharovorans]
MTLKTSVNIKFDVGNDEFIRRYIPSPSHTEALKGILNGFNNNANSSHIVIGPYGTGKSLLATVVSSIVSNSTSSEEINKLIKKFQHFDDYIAEQIEIVSKLDRKYVPVLLTGNEGRFREAILSNIIKTLKNTKNIDIILPGISEKIIESVKNWEINFPNTYKMFVSHLDSQGKELENWLSEIKKQNEEEVIFFSEIYPQLTSGANFDVGYNNDFITQMEYLSRKLEEENIGIIIVYDEFGRFLQGLDTTKLNEAMQDIQDLAEIVSRSDSFHLMLITHKSLRQYFKGNNSDVSKEFQRIEKRFSQYHINSDQITFLKIAEVILSENISNKHLISNEQFINTLDRMKNYSLFPSLNPTDREEKIIKAMYPLHPVSLFLLPNLSGVFGQNERTLFTFLESEETGGLKNHMYKSNDYYKPHQLFDYFFPDLNDMDVDTEIKEHLLIHKKAMARIPDDIKNRKLAMDTLKFITLWNICGLQNEQKISNEFLCFAIEHDEKELISITQKLSDHKVIRFNRVNNYWEVHLGSAINLQEKIENNKNKLKLRQGDILSVLNKNLPKKYFFPEEYNDVKVMTRFAKVEIVLGDEVSKLNVEVVNKSDVAILYIIPKEIDDIKKIKNKLNKMNLKKNVLCAIHPNSLNSILDSIYESYILHDFLNDRSLLSEDKGIKEELTLMSKEINHIITEYLSVLTEFKDQITWLTNSTEIKVENLIDLSNLLSTICFDLYAHTPIILNDSFNRINITSAQRKAAISVVNSILSSPREEQFGIVGNGPDYAIYASIFKRNGNFDKNLNDLNYTEIKNDSYKLIREKVINLIDANPKGSFSDVIKIFTDSPFGIRKPVIPILLVAMLRDRWNEFMLYRNEMYISGLNGETLFEILYEEGPENYHYVYEKFDERYIELFKYVEENFEGHLEDRLVGKSRLIQTCGTLLKWLRSLPRLTQLSKSVEDNLVLLRDTIRKTEVKPQESIAEIYEIFYKIDREKLLQIKGYAEKYLDIFKDNLITRTFEQCNVTSIEDFKKWAAHSHEYLKKNNKLVKVLVGLNNEDWLNQFIEEYIGVSVSDWSDTTYNLYFSQLSTDYQEATNFKEDNKESGNEEEYISVEVAGQKKVISKVEFSVKTNTIYNNVNRMLKNAGRGIPKKEIEYMIYRLFDEYVE